MKKRYILIVTAFSLFNVSEAQLQNTNGNIFYSNSNFVLNTDVNKEVSKCNTASVDHFYQQDSTHELVGLVKDAAELIRTNGEREFSNFRVSGSRWSQGERYIFVLDLEGNMLVHADPGMEGKNQLELKDINGKPIIRGLIAVVTAIPDKPEGWFHYEWPVPGGLLPRWKSSYVRLVTAPSGKSYIVGSGIYNDRMEREFVVDMVKNAVGEIEKHGKSSFKSFHDPTGPFLAKDAYIFVITMDGIEIVNPAFPSIEGRNNIDVKDPTGKFLTREIIKVAQTNGAGWVNYMWPKPGESVSSQKSAYVSKAMLDGEPVVVGCGIYLTDTPKATTSANTMTAIELKAFVRAAAKVFEKRGEKAFPKFRRQGSKWFHDDTYVFVWTLDGVRYFHAANPSFEGMNVSGIKDELGRPFGRMFLDVCATCGGEGWVHYMYNEPGNIFPTWKSSFVKRVTFPSGEQYLVGSGIYNMEMNRTFIVDLVNLAATLVEERGKEAFDKLRNKTGPFVFMDTYVFVDNLEGVELVNAGQPSLEGKNIINVMDVNGKYMVREYIDAAVKYGSAWVDYYWYKPGENTPTKKSTYVIKVVSGGETYVVGAGVYLDE